MSKQLLTMFSNSGVLIIVIFALFGAVFGQISNNLDNSEKGNPDINDLEKQLEENGIKLPDMNRTKIDPNKVENVLREKCRKQNSTDAVDILKNQQDTLKECVLQHINTTQLQLELDESKKTGSMDEVFAKYCNKWPNVYGCLDNVTVTVRQCMSGQEEKAFNKTLDIVQEFQEFMCHKDGDRLAMFVAEGGVECLQEQQEGIKDCFNSTVGARLPEGDDLSVATVPVFLFSEDDCEDFEKVRLCINGVLEKCHDTTPANIIDASFKFLKKQMPCEQNEQQVSVKVEAKSLQTSSAYSIRSSVYFIFGYLLLFKFF